MPGPEPTHGSLPLAQTREFGLDAGGAKGAESSIADVVLPAGRGSPTDTCAGSIGGLAMPTYVVLGSYTDQGIRNIKDSLKRTEAVKEMAKKAGVTLKETYWTLGQYDLVSIMEAPDDVSITSLGLSIGKLGNVRTQTLRAFSADDMKGILGKVM